MKRFVSLVLCLVLTLTMFAGLSVTASATEESEFEYEVSNSQVTITACYSEATKVEIPSKIKGYPVTKIDEYAFAFCENLKSVSIPNTVTHIKDYAFSSCVKLTSITLPSNLLYIGEGAFSGTAIKSITIPAKVKSIKSTAFMMCEKLTTFKVAADNKYFSTVNGVLFNKSKAKLVIYPSGKTATSYSIPSGTKTVGKLAFNWNNILTSVKFPSSVTTLEEGAFTFCMALSSVNIPGNITTISNSAFAFCTALKSVKIASGVKTIESAAFAYDFSLKTVSIPNSVTKISDEAFAESDSVVIYCNCNSYAYKYARFNEINYNRLHSLEGNTCTKCKANFNELTPKLGSAVNTVSGVRLTWYSMPGAQQYVVYRKTTGGWVKLAQTASTNYIDKTAKSGTTYKYTVRAVRNNKYSNYNENGRTVTYLAAPKFKLTNSAEGITVSISKVQGAKSYRIYRKTDGGFFERIKTTTSTSYVDTTAQTGVDYTYAVRAVNGNATSNYYLVGLSILYPNYTK